MCALIKSSTRILAIACLAVGLSAIGSAQEATSISGALTNANQVGNTAPSVLRGEGGGHSGGGHNGGGSGGHNGGGSGGHNGGGGGNPPPNCVPEPASMLALGAGAGLMAWKRRRANKA